MLLWLSRLQFRKPLTKLSAESTGTLRSVANFFSFPVEKNASFGFFFRIRFDKLFRFRSKIIRTSKLPARRKLYKEEDLSKKISRENFSGVLLKAGLKILTKLSAETSKILSQLPFSHLIFSRKASSDCFSRHVDSSLDHVFWIFDRKRLLIISQIFKHSRFLQKKTSNLKMFHLTFRLQSWQPQT